MWNELLTTALVGTKRRPFKLENLPDGKLGELLAQVTQRTQDAPEHALLGAAAAYTLYRRAGQVLPLDDTPLPEPCDPDDLPPCNPRVALQLIQMVTHAQNSPMHEWFGATTQMGKRIADEYLPVVLTYYQTRQNHLPLTLFDALGKRGRWLAQQNPAWAYAVLPADDAKWKLAERAARVTYLQKLRQTDPAQARTLLESVWAGENAESRAELIRTLEINLLLDDEPFLETALDDRSANVCLTAQTLLARLPESAFSRRMVARAEQFIKISRRGKKLIIDITLPETSDDPLIRDGAPLEPPAASGLGARAYWLFRIARSLPSSYWLQGNWTPVELVRAVNNNSEWKKLLLDALGDVAESEAEHELAEALLMHGESDEPSGIPTLKAATPDVREAYVLQVFAKDKQPLNIEHPAIKLLHRLCESNHHWSKTLTMAFIDAARETLKKGKATELSSVSTYLPTYSLKMYPDVSSELKTLDIKGSVHVWASAVRNCIHVLEFRQSMLKELSR
jgi:hypothetical protein